VKTILINLKTNKYIDTTHLTIRPLNKDERKKYVKRIINGKKNG
jgi:hypothetical protein